MHRLLLPTLLIGCGTLEGGWEGKGDCGAQVEGVSSSWALSFELEPFVESDYTGTGTYRSRVDVPDDHPSLQDQDILFDFDITVQTDGPGEQRIEVESSSTGCELKLDGKEKDAEAAGYPCDGDELFKGWKFNWDGANRIRFQNDGCDGNLERS